MDLDRGFAGFFMVLVGALLGPDGSLLRVLLLKILQVLARIVKNLQRS